MRRILILILLTISLYGQGQVLTASFAPIRSNITFLRNIDGAGTGNAKFGFDGSIEYLRSRNNKYTIGLGLSYQYSRVEMVPAPLPPFDQSPHNETVNLLTASFKILRNFQREYYLSLNPLLNLQLPSSSQDWIDNHTGLGFSFSIGKRIPVNEKLAIALEPIVWFHNIIPFVDESNYTDRLTVVGIKAGISLMK
jgi:hypothetical protein